MVAQPQSKRQVPRQREIHRRGALVVLEGVDGVGKTTLANKLVRTLNTQGLRARYASFPGRAPGSLGAHVYELYHHPRDFGIRSCSQQSLQILITAAHVEVVVSEILPALMNGYIIVLDRFWWSTWVYGQAARVPAAFLRKLIQLENDSWGRVAPATVFLLTRSVGARHLEHSRRKHDQLVRRYRLLARRESDSGPCPVETVTNDGSIRETVDKLVNSLRRRRIFR